MTDDYLEELALFWWGSDNDERTVTDVIESGSMAEFARYVLDNFVNRTMTETHPITPPPELAEKWALMFENHTDTEVFTEVARWGADQELEACCELIGSAYVRDKVRATRRPKPLNPRELALATLRKLSTSGYPCNLQQNEDWDTIRQALEQLDD